MRTRAASTRVIGLMAAGLLTVTACGSSPTSSADGQQGPTKAEKAYAELQNVSQAELVKRAKAEGELDLYTSMTAEVVDEVVSVFGDTYDIDVNVYRANSETVLQRLLQEQSAGYAGNDVVETNATEMMALQQEDLLAPYRGEARAAVRELGKFETWTATRFNIFAPSWNTNKVSPAELPKTWEDLADPKWDGKLAMELDDYDWFLTLYGYFLDQGKSEQEVQRIFHRMAQGAKVVKGHTVQAELLSAGQFAVAASNYTYIIESLKRRGAPIDYRPVVEPAIARPNGIGLMKTAQHPAAAMLFTEWLLTEGQQVIADMGLVPSVNNVESPLKDVEVIPVDMQELVNESDKWSKRYQQVIRAGEQVEGGS